MASTSLSRKEDDASSWTRSRKVWLSPSSLTWIDWPSSLRRWLLMATPWVGPAETEAHFDPVDNRPAFIGGQVELWHQLDPVAQTSLPLALRPTCRLLDEGDGSAGRSFNVDLPELITVHARGGSGDMGIFSEAASNSRQQQD